MKMKNYYNRKNKTKKSQLNNVFIYLLSIVIVVFCGFLVTKFVISFSDDAKTATENKIINTMKEDFKQVYIKYGAENQNTYRLSENVKTICFVQKSCNSTSIAGLDQNQQNALNSVIIGGDNIALFDSTNIITSDNLGDFQVKDGTGCLCIKPNNNRINMIFSNEKNTVWIGVNN